MNSNAKVTVLPKVKGKKPRDFNYYSGKKYDGMMGRCYREGDKSYKNYGERGIKVCSAWIKDIHSFRAWLLLELERCNIPVEEFINKSRHIQLDRIDVNDHYSPSNCRLTSCQTNTRNRRISAGKTIISAEGEEITW